MKRINAAISDEACDVLEKYQKGQKLKNKDSALDALLLEWGREKP
jgi:hypothetical protein